VAGEIVGGRPSINGTKGYLSCRFQDKDGGWHESCHQVDLRDQFPAMRKGIGAAPFPIPVHIKYDPRWPERCWILEFGKNDAGNRLAAMSGSFFLFQVILIPSALYFGITRVSAGTIPLITLVPFWTDMVPFLLGACAKFVIGEW
jgi:hypothetical protein